MEIRKYLNGVTEKEEEAINDFLAKYPKLDEYELLEMVKKELPSNNITKVFYTIVNKHWKELQKTNLLCWDITVYLTGLGYKGTNIEKYYLGLILDHIYKEYASANDIRELIDNLVDYLSDKEHTYSNFIETLKKTKLGKKNIPYETLMHIATIDVTELDQMYERLERCKEYDRENTR